VNTHAQKSPTSGAQVSHWTLPTSGFVKMKVDGTVARNLNSGSFSAICGDKREIFLGDLTMKVEGISNISV
jgi:hypothetical protein